HFRCNAPPRPPFLLRAAASSAATGTRAHYIFMGANRFRSLRAMTPTMNAIALENRYAAHNYAPLPVVLARGEGAHLWDIEGRRYVDMMSAYSAASHGHAHPRIIAALEAQARRLAVPSRAYFNDRLGPLLAELCELSGLDAALPMNTGAEAVETAI